MKLRRGRTGRGGEGCAGGGRTVDMTMSFMASGWLWPMSRMKLLPRLLVMMMMVFLKLTLRPCARAGAPCVRWSANQA